LQENQKLNVSFLFFSNLVLFSSNTKFFLVGNIIN
jgi:hypothetical protein